MASSNTTLKLLVDKRAKKVLFAEANKEFVDFLFHVFSLPLGTLIELLGSKQMVGCLGKLKESVEIFNQTFLQPGIVKDDIFNPKTAFKGNKFLTSNHASQDTPKQLYKCSSYNMYGSLPHNNVTEYRNAVCPSCSRVMNVPLTLFTPKEYKEEAERKKKKITEGYVKEVVIYIVMDNLVVKPMSTLSTITLINSLGVKDLTQLEEKTVSFGKDEALKLLKASLMTDQVLTTLFRKTTLFPKKEDD